MTSCFTTHRSTSSPNGDRSAERTSSPAPLTVYSPWGAQPLSMDRPAWQRLDPCSSVTGSSISQIEANQDGAANHGNFTQEYGKGQAHV